MLTSTTAPGKTFSSRAELADHYKSDWHKYNLKRREAGLPLLEEADFLARWEAALAIRKEKEAKSQSGTDHLKHKRASAKKSQTPAAKKISNQDSDSEEDDEDDDTPMETIGKQMPKKLMESQENPSIDPTESLFDNHMSKSLEENVQYMHLKFGFFIPDRECLVDLEGLLGYCQEKVKLGHYCLYCDKVFPTWQGCQNHMISKQHAKLRYEQGYWDELDPFYDFKTDDAQFAVGKTKDDGERKVGDVDMAVAAEDGDEDGWEDVAEDEEVYDGYEREIAKFGLDVTPLGEIIFPDGRIIGHRALKRYYKQNIRPVNNTRAVVAARRAAGERLHDGQVVSFSGAGAMPTKQLKGVGKGILVGLKDGVEGFSAVSLYRYRAAVRKQRRNDVQGQRLQYRSTLNMNRMDKKANRLMNGVSVAHALR